MFVPCNYATVIILINLNAKKTTCRLCLCVGRAPHAFSVTLVKFRNKEYYLVLCLFLLIGKNRGHSTRSVKSISFNLNLKVSNETIYYFKLRKLLALFI
jgi:hypothetical protein